MHERQVELFTEWGHRWYDLKRTGRAGAVLGAEKTGWTADAALYPVPMAQLQSNINLKQNPGY
ncbi:RagB/SusD family nutrient uptake outer membrane protein [Puia sp. P3]|uniref:RagB/SusD family nutrient uptake outer membrane protein n=1 Tax=Puia sp. P3 TaxID=3423952 RepID=UPI003D679157